MSFIKPTFFSRIASVRNFRKAAVTLHGNITARAQTRCGGISSVGGGGATLNRPEIASNFTQFRRFSAEPDRQLTWRVTVPGNQAYVIEREGKYLKTLYTNPDAPHLLDCSTDKIAFTHSLEKDVELSTQLSMTTDGHPWGLGLIFNVKVVDPYLASYGHGVKDGDSISAFKELATMMMSAALEEVSLGDYIFSKDLVERERVLKDSIDVLDDMNKIVAGWGLKCLDFNVVNFVFPEFYCKWFGYCSAKLARRQTAEKEAELLE